MSALVAYLTHGRDRFVDQTFLVVAHAVGFPNRLLVVHNGPRETASRLFSGYPTLILGENRGLVGGTNAAMAMRRPGEHFVRVNDDAMPLRHDWLDDLLQQTARRPDAGLVGHSYEDARHGRPKVFVRGELRKIGNDWARTRTVTAPIVLITERACQLAGGLWQPPDWAHGWWPASSEYSRRVQLFGLQCYYVSTGAFRVVERGQMASRHWTRHIDAEMKHNYDPKFWATCRPTVARRLQLLRAKRIKRHVPVEAIDGNYH